MLQMSGQLIKFITEKFKSETSTKIDEEGGVRSEFENKFRVSF